MSSRCSIILDCYNIALALARTTLPIPILSVNSHFPLFFVKHFSLKKAPEFPFFVQGISLLSAKHFLKHPDTLVRVPSGSCGLQKWADEHDAPDGLSWRLPSGHLWISLPIWRITDWSSVSGSCSHSYLISQFFSQNMGVPNNLWCFTQFIYTPISETRL